MQTPNYKVMVKGFNLGQVQVLNMTTYYEIHSFEGHIVTCIRIIEIDLTLIVISETRLIGFLYIKQ